MGSLVLDSKPSNLDIVLLRFLKMCFDSLVLGLRGERLKLVWKMDFWKKEQNPNLEVKLGP